MKSFGLNSFNYSQYLLVIGTAAMILAGCASANRPARNPANQKVLRVGMISDPVTFDPHYSFVDLSYSVNKMIYEGLFEPGPNKEVVPQLALDGAVSPQNHLLWTFNLKKDVVFHRGQKFTKEDVLCTFRRMLSYAPHSANRFSAAQVDAVDLPATEEANKLEADPHVLKIVTKKPYAILKGGLGGVLILSCDDAQEAMRIDANDKDAIGKPVSEKTRAAFDRGHLANGTGPYKFKKWEKNNVVEVVWNEGFHGTRRTKWDLIQVLPELDDNKRVERLFANDLHVITNVPGGRFKEIKDKSFPVFKSPSLRVIHLQMYQNKDDREKSPLHIPLQDTDGNSYTETPPFTSLKFRKAIATSIDKNILLDVMEGDAIPTGQYMLKGRPGHMPNYPTHFFNPRKAQRLFAEASREKGMEYLKNKKLILTIQGPNDRYPNDAKILDSLAAQMTKVFSDFTVDGARYSMTVKAFSQSKNLILDNASKVNAVLIGGGVDNGHVSGALRIYFLPKSSLNYGNYKNLKVQELFDQGLADTNAKTSDATLTAGLKIALDEFALIPLYNQYGIWAAAPGYGLEPRIDDVTFPDRVWREE